MRNVRSNKSQKTKSTVIFIVLVCLVGLLAYSGFAGIKNIFGYRVKPFSEAINRGLDLQGGISVLEEIKADNVDNDTIERTIEMLSMRVNPDGVKEISIQREGKNKIRIEIPGEFDSKKVLDSIGKTGKLEFKGPDDKVILTGSDVENATAYLDDMGNPTIGLELKSEGTKKFAEATKKFLNQPISIYMDEELLTSPTVQSVITNGKATITGSKSLEEAKRQANIIKSGALPVTLEAVEFKTVGATLGSNALPLSMKAGAIGISLILLFMIIYYRRPGIMASIALIIYVILVLGTFAAVGVTLTLSGIAGFLLTVGMAVDANVLIFERIKEELKLGKSIKTAVDAGFNRALSSILDSNITTIIAAVVLYYLGSGAVKGFATTLMIGIIISIFTALTITKALIKLGMEMGILNNVSHFGVKRG
ncbi:protein translocase subunit SecD [Clostridium thermopalmarium]|uniref:Protein translocase subunit SecD n=1 Tax=Clostridium thermopalmarium DSM 5974 TaxID=1121340 RepID=A0A2T0AX79_9CLOT|nr:protein translocase subunit SecD [Clostridium thermopalmarium]PRR75416.1 preprotein translocase subunit SecD [Clostridium thermopalmarium DSM 5974]PVZ24318.1 preprotein translocase subunit SecD [Clostridium thermopalmarium DSM 5974]